MAIGRGGVDGIDSLPTLTSIFDRYVLDRDQGVDYRHDALDEFGRIGSHSDGTITRCSRKYILDRSRMGALEQSVVDRDRPLGEDMANNRINCDRLTTRHCRISHCC